MKKDRWVPLRRAAAKPLTKELVIAASQALDGDEELAMRMLEKEAEKTEYWINDLYQVQVTRFGDDNPGVHLNIRRRDGKPIFRDWRHFQRIKNELVGEECEGVELYPAESRCVDSSNKYHLWCVADPTYRFPLGFTERDVRGPVENPTHGTTQRKFR